MENLHHGMVSHKTAWLANKLGCDTSCEFWYDNNKYGQLQYGVHGYPAERIQRGQGVKAQYQWRVMQWLRTKDIHIEIGHYHSINSPKPFGLFIEYKLGDYWMYLEYSGEQDYVTYEEAIEHGIYESLKMLNNR